MHTGPALREYRACMCCSRSEPKESRTRGSRPNDSPSTAVRLRHLAGVYCLDSRDHRPFVLEFLASTGSQCRPPHEHSSSVAYVPATHTRIIPKSGRRDKRIFHVSKTFVGIAGSRLLMNTRERFPIGAGFGTFVVLNRPTVDELQSRLTH